MKPILSSIIICLIITLPITTKSQKNTLAKADEYFENLDYALALQNYIELLKNDSTNLYLIKRIADSYFFISDYNKSLPYYEKLANSPNPETEDLFHYAQLLKISGKTDQALTWYKKYSILMPNDKRVQMELGNTDLVKTSDKTASSYKIWNLKFNTKNIDMCPMDYKNQLVFASSGNILKKKAMTISGFNNQPFLELYSVDDTANLDQISIFSDKINTKYHEGPVCFSNDGNTMYFTRNNFIGITFKQQAAKLNNLKIFIAKWNGTEWADVSEFPYNSDKYSVGHATLSPDDNTIYFSSNMPGGFGATDIYYCKLVDGKWGKPVNMGAEINSEGNEMFPYVDHKGVLYFSSNGFPGLGGLDIFMAVHNDDGSYKLINLGKPLNSSYDDFGFIKKDQDCSGYFTSNRPGGKGYDDIYGFKIESAKLSVKCIDSKTQKILSGASIFLKSITNDLITSTSSDKEGNAVFFVEPCNSYIISGEKEFYSGDTKTVTFDIGDIELGKELDLNLAKQVPNLRVRIIDKDTKSVIDDAKLSYTDEHEKMNVNCIDGVASIDFTPGLTFGFFGTANGYFGNSSTYASRKDDLNPQELVIELEKIVEGKVIVLRDIYYDLNKWNIRPDAAAELDKLVKVLKENPEVKVELSSHTDCRASETYNNRLSQRRAEAAVDYLVENGIDRKRLVAKGYGETRLVNRCADGVQCSEEEHQANRRTELKILESKVHTENNIDVSVKPAKESGQSVNKNDGSTGSKKANSTNAKTENTKSGDKISNLAYSYYLVAGSFKSSENADKFMSELSAKGYKPESIATSKNPYNVTVGGYNNWADAVEAQKKYLAENPESGAWILKE